MTGATAVTWEILHGECADVMRSMPAESVDAIITSPPYAMQRKATYGGIPEADYPAWTVAWMNEARRVLKPDGNVVINIRPHVRNGQISDYTLRTRLALREDGWNEVEELIWHKSNGMPTGSPTRPRRTWESLHWFAKHGRSFGDPKAAGVPPVWATNMDKSRATRNGWDHSGKGGMTTPDIARVTDVVPIRLGRPNKSDSRIVNHPATYPWQLAEWIAALTCPPGGTILDPFNGSGSTGVAAIRNGWNYIGIDAVPEYVEMSRRRLAAVEAEAA